MTLDETLRQKLADWQPPGDGRQTLIVPDEGAGWTVQMTADRHNDLGSSLWEVLMLRTSTPRAQGSEALRAWAERICGRVTGLLEPLHVVEIDTQRQEALLRSENPARRGQDLCYYELLLKGTAQAILRRYQAVREAGRREQVPFTLTHEVLAKFVVDVTAD
jgi:hypothetical protein